MAGLAACNEVVVEEDNSSMQAEADSLQAIFEAHQALVVPTIDTFFVNRFNAQTFNGNVLFAYKGQVLYQNQFGYANFNTKDTLTPASSFQLASASKPFTATAIMMLEEQGLLSYDDSLQQFFPNFPYHGITVRMLLTHRGGLSNYTYFSDEHWPDWYVTITNDDVIKLMYDHQPMYYFLPGRKFDYSNTGYMLLASIVERVTDQYFEVWMQENIFEPLDMQNTSIYNRWWNTEMYRNTIGYNWKQQPMEDTYLNGVVGDKGVYSTVEDLLKFDRALNEGRLLSDSTLALAYAPANEERPNKPNYGFGWRLSTYDSLQVVYHTGWWKGYRSYFVRLPEEGSSIIVLNNIKRGPFLKVKQLVQLLYGTTIPIISDSSTVL